MLFAAQAQDKGLMIAADVDEGLPPRLHGDAGRLRQIISNFVGNAIRFTEIGEVVIGVRRMTEAGGATRLRFEVKDTGSGLDEAAQAKLFTAFSQADVSTARTSGGTGLGLAICKKLVVMMNGAIGVVSAPGKGSTFWFEVSLGKGAAMAPAEAPGAAGVRVLIVDHVETSRRIMAQQVAAWRMRPHGVADGASALAAMRAAETEGDPFILALIDMQMPAMDGAQVALEIKSDAALVAVRMILLSTLSAAPGREELSIQGFDGVLTWPVRKAALHNAISDALSAHSTGHATARKSLGVEPRASWKALRILVADDNAVDQKMALFHLQSLGCKADVVANGREAMSAVASPHYDLVLMDCRMPEMDGYEATAAIRARPAMEGRKLVIIGMTVSALDGDRQRCLSAGMDDHVAKPVSVEDLAAALGRWYA
jgi:CheY-like chemotaxis protein